jgi:hypothetical protein
VQTWVAAGRVSFLPYCDPYTEETPAMRRMYLTMLRNPVAKTALLTKVQSVAALDLQTTPASEEPRDEEVAEFIRYALTDALDMGFPGACEEILVPGLVKPPNVVESVWHDSLWPRGRWRGKRMYRCFKSKEFADPMQDEYRNIVGIRAGGYGQSRVYDLEDFIVFQNLSLYQGPGMSDMRAAYTAMWELDTVAKLHVIHLEKYIDPYLVATNVDKDYQAALGVELEKAKARRWLIPPDGAIVQAMSLSQKGPAEYLEFCKDRREQITLSISGAFLQMLTAVSGGDIRGNARTQQSTSELLVWALAAKLANDLKTSVVPRLVDVNYLDADYPAVSLGGINYAELKQAIEIEDRAQQMGFPLSAKAFGRKYALQRAVDDADTLKRVPNAPPPGMGGGLPFADPPPVRPNRPRDSSGGMPRGRRPDDDEPERFCGGPGSGVPGPCPEGGGDKGGGSSPIPGADVLKGRLAAAGLHLDPAKVLPAHGEVKFSPGPKKAKDVRVVAQMHHLTGRLELIDSPHLTEPEKMEAAVHEMTHALDRQLGPQPETPGVGMAKPSSADPSTPLGKLAAEALQIDSFKKGIESLGYRGHELPEEAVAYLGSRWARKEMGQPVSDNSKLDALLPAFGAILKAHAGSGRQVLSDAERYCGGPGSGVPGPCPTGVAERPKTGRMPHATNDANQTIHEAARPALEKTEAEAAAWYTKSGHDPLNEALRGDGEETLTGKLAAVNDQLQAAFAKVQPLPQPVKVYRALSISGPKKEKFIAALKDAQAGGKHMEMIGYSSTSTNPAFQDQWGGSVRFEIDATKGLDMKPYSDKPAEDELLLNHGSRFEVQSVEPDGPRWKVKLRQVS